MNRPRNPGLRNKIVAVLASLVALWAFAAYVTVGEGVSLVWLATLEQQVAKPTEALIAAVQEERRESVAYAAAGTAESRTAMDSARAATDQAAAKLRGALKGTAAQWSTSAASDARLADLLAGLDTLTPHRSDLDAGRMDRVAAGDYFTGLTQLGFDVYDTYTAWDDSEVIYHTSTLVLLTHSQEMISREDAVVSGVLAAGRLTETDRATLTQLVGAQRYLSRQVADRLPQPDRGEYEQLLAGPELTALRALEARLMAAGPGAAPHVEAAAWRSTATGAIEALRTLVLTLADLTVVRFRGAAVWIVIRLVLAAGLGLVAVVASIRFTIRTLRNLQDQLAELRVAALDLAQHRLPRVVERLRLGEEVDVAEAAPPLAYGTGDIGQVGHAFNEVQQTAIQATVDQAALRRGVRDVFLSLSHRIQALVHRQLKLIDHMERQAVTDEELADLFRIDHLATRMRRNAENLVVLAGVPASRTWRGPVPLIDVIRAALAEVEDYPRVRLRSADPAAVAGRAVGDLIHLLAELMENALSFSSPQTVVVVAGRAVPAGYLIEIEDRGLGMTDQDLAEANRQLADPPEFQLTGAARLGFYVVGRLAARHRIEVLLRRSADAGVVASVLVPAAFLDQEAAGAERPHERLLATVAAATAAAPAAWPAWDSHTPPGGVAADTPPTGVPVPAAGDTPQTPVGLPWRQKRPKAPAAPPVQVPRPRDLQELEQTAEVYPNGRTPAEVGRFLAAYVNAVHQGRERAERPAPAAD
ncbi:nitrate- and nitrite sensing domain-containing protein [Catellatospora sp. KI3]|uniref:sensor histidine kinase n=1 Tax=Catellatospora sp. KI3 TaxID=3041620 RepID=UPI002482736E|nr:nitrate- and nitrite sensing domain-containing protein [Catellatospora sp. KI3]MDI1463688.1 nitrate- and nitrite sensing domain-containing protein [Catellatospora sp. KI3]